MKTPVLFHDCAKKLLLAERNRDAMPPLTEEYPSMTIEDGYRIQKESIGLSGERVVGLKAALTSKAKQKAMGVDQAGYGVLLSRMRSFGNISRDELIHPRVEPEIALFFEDFHPEGELDSLDVARHVRGIAPALEIIDSRYVNFKFTAADVYADNCSSARYVLSHPILDVVPDDLHLRGVILEKNGRILQTGTPAAVLGHPFVSAAFILNLARKNRVELPSSFVLLTGGITDAVPVEAGDRVRAVFAGLGDADVLFV